MRNITAKAGKLSAHRSNGKRPAHRILVVEDEPDMRRLNSEILINSGYHVDAAKNGAAAWEALQLKDYHLMITDNDMPKVTGVDLLKKLHAAHMALPVIMVAGTLPHEQFARHPWIQPAAVLLKPYSVVELLGTVKKILRTTSDARQQA